MGSFTADELSAMVEQLEAYVRSDASFRAIVVEAGGGTHRVTLTLGVLLQAAASADSGLDTSRASNFVKAVREEYPDEWSHKLVRELRSATNLWCARIDDLEQGDGGGSWANEAMRRTRAERLIEEAELVGVDISDQRARIEACDRRAKRFVSPAPFALDETLMEQHPRSRYWWLFARTGAS